MNIWPNVEEFSGVAVDYNRSGDGSAILSNDMGKG